MQYSNRIGSITKGAPIKLYGVVGLDKDDNIVRQKIFTTQRKAKQYVQWMYQYIEYTKNNKVSSGYSQAFRFVRVKEYVTEAVWDAKEHKQLELELESSND